MKRTITILGVLLCLQPLSHGGGSGTVLGALIGAAAGWALGEESGDIETAVSVPILAVAGGLAGHYLEKRHDGAKDLQRQIRVAGTASPTPRRTAPVDYHPGIDLIKISIVTSNGMRIDIPIIRAGNRFIGPQGEEYTELPTTVVLTAKYGF